MNGVEYIISYNIISYHITYYSIVYRLLAWRLAHTSFPSTSDCRLWPSGTSCDRPVWTPSDPWPVSALSRHLLIHGPGMSMLRLDTY